MPNRTTQRQALLQLWGADNVNYTRDGKETNLVGSFCLYCSALVEEVNLLLETCNTV